MFKLDPQSILLLVVVSMILTISIRLLIRGSTGSDQPVRLIGGFFLCFAGMLLLRAAGTQPDVLGVQVTKALFHAGNACYVGSDVILLMFTWKVFRPHVRWARLLATCVGATMVSVWIGRLIFGEHRALLLLLAAVRMVPFSWAFIESVGYYRMMRRRVKLGLADPVIANRFFLWSVWTGAMGALPIFVVTLRLIALAQGVMIDPLQGVSGEKTIEISPVLKTAIGVIAAGGISAVFAMWLSFFPPRVYVGWLRRRGVQEAV